MTLLPIKKNNRKSYFDEGARFENMVALELMRAVKYWNDAGSGRFALHYVRNKEKKEVDFLIVEDNRPVLLIETKLSKNSPASSLLYFQELLDVPAVQLVHKEGVFKKIKNNNRNLLIITAHRWLAGL